MERERSGLATTISRRKALAYLLTAMAGVSAGVAEPVSPGRDQSRRKTALVLGNGDYHKAPLKNPVNDATLMRQTLRDLDFEVDILLNAGLQQMIDSTRGWLANSVEASSRIFYYAGHGAQSAGSNYLIPVDCDSFTDEDIATKAFNASNVVDRLAGFESGVNVVILDACRTPPAPSFGGQFKGRGVGKMITPGLAATAAPRGTLIAFSTSPGLVASDSRASANSVYTRHLADQMRVAGEPIEAVFKQVRLAVMQETGNTQIPWESSSLVGDFCFQPGNGAECGSTYQSRPETQQQGVDLKRL